MYTFIKDYYTEFKDIKIVPLICPNSCQPELAANISISVLPLFLLYLWLLVYSVND